MMCERKCEGVHGGLALLRRIQGISNASLVLLWQMILDPESARRGLHKHGACDDGPRQHEKKANRSRCKKQRYAAVLL